MTPGLAEADPAGSAHPSKEINEMSKFNVGDKVQMPGVPFVVEVLEIGTCDDARCEDRETFRFKDPGGLGDDWMHTAEFELAQ